MLTKETREAVIDALASNEAESFRDYDMSDFYDLAVNGQTGYNDSSDEDLIESLIYYAGDRGEDDEQYILLCKAQAEMAIHQVLTETPTPQTDSNNNYK